MQGGGWFCVRVAPALHPCACLLLAEALGRPGNKKDVTTRTVRVLRAVGEISGQLLHELRTLPPHILVGTPTALGRLVPDVLNLSDLQFLVLDEADE